MILFIRQELSVTDTDANIYQLDLTTSEFSTSEFVPGAFVDFNNLVTQSVAQVNIHGKPAFLEATSFFGRVKDQVLVNMGKELFPQVYLYYSPTSENYTHRARVYAIDFALDTSGGYFLPGMRFVPATITITHGIWQGELTEIPLYNSLVTPKALGGLTIQNSIDATKDCQAYIDATDVIGDLPAPIKLKVTNLSATDEIISYYVSNTAYINQGADMLYEGEAAVPLTNVARALASNGNINQITVTSDTETDKLTWTLTNVHYYAGNQFHLIVRGYALNSLSNEVFYRFKMEKPATGILYWKGDQVTFPNAGALTTQFGDYGVIRIPPWIMNDREPRQLMELVMSCAKVTAATANKTIDIDAIYLFPVDSFRHTVFPFLPTQNEYIVDDMIDEWAYGVDNVSDRIGGVISLGSKVYVYPGRTQRLYFLNNHNGGDTSETTMKVQVWYRPLRLAL